MSICIFQAQNVLEAYNLKNAEEERLWKKQILKVYVNCAICCDKIGHFGRTITYCNQALELDRSCVKAHYFKGKVSIFVSKVQTKILKVSHSFIVLN